MMRNTKATYSAVLGFVLSNLRKERGIEQGDMAIRMGLTQASYSRLEGGKSAFSVDQMYQAAEALDLSALTIIGALDKYSSHLESDGVHVEPQVRSNTTKATQTKNSGNEVVSFVAGATLGALLLKILSKK
jgi:transcriptional regulator with XRE-family HTH domain